MRERHFKLYVHLEKTHIITIKMRYYPFLVTLHCLLLDGFSSR